MRRKYIDERFGNYLPDFHLDGSIAHTGNDWIAVQGDLCTREFVVKRDEELLDFIFRMASAFSDADNEAFQRFYYGDNKQ